ncbi:carboxymethylenebutenolidase [Terrihabitans soli]|uniref:Carboxymethylenebutenolidase n=1 Tax=Terrihabitans soli TaxID=708113 RepID=A0A6S6QVU4_9HYPH|nr:dienelactone hydrolase family protein [Terrihabitans soli]BCJ91695.1 carboxymethylenebutenolidase [Terrihabitans soli]
MDQRIIDLYDSFTHGQISRREFTDRLTKVAGSAAAAAALLPVLQNNYAQAAIVPEDDKRLVIQNVTFDAPNGKVNGYVTRPKGGAARLPAVVVIHENRGLNPHIKDVTRRLALEGFLVLAPDLLTPLGGTPENEDQARDLIAKLEPLPNITNIAASVGHLAQSGSSTGKVGAVGFCWGGARASEIASVAPPPLAAAVSYYGMGLAAKNVGTIKAPLLLHYAGLDERVNASIADYKKALDEAGKTYELFMYDGANHAFNNDTNPARYNKAAADLAWKRTVDFLKKNLA